MPVLHVQDELQANARHVDAQEYVDEELFLSQEVESRDLISPLDVCLLVYFSFLPIFKPKHLHRGAVQRNENGPEVQLESRKERV